MRRLGKLCLVACLAALAGVQAGGQAAGERPAAPGGGPGVATGDRTITLITGDVITVNHNGVPIEARGATQRRGVQFRTWKAGGHRYVVPDDAVPALVAGRLDRRLFDITTLLEFGYEDGKRADVPVLVEAGAGLSGQGVRSLPELGLSSVAVPKARAAEAWTALQGAKTMGAGKIWLNGVVRPLLDESVRLVGAPAAWAAGHTGKGSTVAVLDTGYDPEHPDLAGVVVRAQDFTGSAVGIRDEVGHGTHVASTIAGRGSASGGKYVGVARDAALMVGKVCKDWCPEDAILAGMSWAAREARVVNMSLGGSPSDGTDLLSLAVNRLSKEHGTLFVVAAGNFGETATVSSPASADAALAVANTTKNDTLSPSSSRGPRVGDQAVKPDIAAPGTDIVAARARDGRFPPVDGEHYTQATGTSMAAPHVAGAAAILAAQHPDWTGERIKSVLMSTTFAGNNLGAFEQGTGRLDVARAVGQRVYADQGGVHLGVLPWPHTGQQPVRQSVSYRNDSDVAVTLSLSLRMSTVDGRAVADGQFQVSPPTVTVPGRSGATVSVSVDRTKGTGAFGGRLVARSADGAITVNTTVGGYVQEEHHELAVELKQRPGRATSTWVLATPTGAGDGVLLPIGPDGVARARLPVGDYTVLASTAEIDADVPNPFEPTALIELTAPSVRMNADRVLTADANVAKPVTVTFDDPSVRIYTMGTAVLAGPDGLMSVRDILSSDTEHLVGSLGGMSPGFRYHTYVAATVPDISLTLRSPSRTEIPTRYSFESPRLPGRHAFTIVDGGAGTAADLAKVDVKGKLVLLRVGQDDATERVRAVAAAGGAAVLLQTPAWMSGATPVPVLEISQVRASSLAASLAIGPVTAESVGITGSPVSYDVVLTERGRMPDGKHYHVRKADLARIDTDYRSPAPNTVGYGVARPNIGDYGFFFLRRWPPPALALPARRTEYVSPGRWAHQFLVGDSARVGAFFTAGWSDVVPSEYRAGQNYRRERGSAVFAPVLRTEQPAAFRLGNYIQATVLPLSTGATGPGAPPMIGSADGLSGSSTLYRDGVLVGRTDFPGFGTWAGLPLAAARYQLNLDATHQSPQLRSSTKVATSWTFRSSTVDGDRPAPLPLLEIGYRVALDEHNTAPAGRPMPLRLTATRQPGAGTATVNTMRLAVSYDGGQRWEPVPTVHIGQEWCALLPPGGAAGGQVSLRVKAGDTDGNEVEQTVVNAYGLR